MGRTCTVCSHKDVDEINRLLLCSDSYRDIARQFGLSKDALARHKESHIPELLSKSQDAKDTLQADNLLIQLQAAREETLRLLDMAIEAGNTRTYGAPSNYLAELRQQIKLWAELEGKLATQPTINVLILPEWLALREKIVAALRPYPKALEAVRNAIK